MTIDIRTFKDLLVWQKAFDLCVEVYRFSGEFPRLELYGLSSELRKTARSVVCNIAEGHKRRSTLEYIHFLRISAGSSAELESQILLSERLGYLKQETAADGYAASFPKSRECLTPLSEALNQSFPPNPSNP